MQNIYFVILKIAAENRLKNEASGILLRYITVTFVICMFDKVSVAVSESVNGGQSWVGGYWNEDGCFALVQTLRNAYTHKCMAAHIFGST